MVRVWLIISCFVTGCLASNFNGIVTSLTQFVTRRYFSSCVTIFYSLNSTWQEKREVFLNARSLHVDMEDRFLVRVVPLTGYAKEPPDTRCVHITFVILAWQSNIKEDFNQSPRLLDMSNCWLLFFLPHISAKNFLQDAYVPYDAVFLALTIMDKGNVDIQEAHRVHTSYPLRIHPFGSWNATHFTGPQGNLMFSNPFNMEGFPIRLSTKDDYPISKLARSKTGEYVVEGYFGMVVKELAERMNFTAVYVSTKENVTGRQTKGKWNGLLGMLQRDETDLAVGPMSMNPTLLGVARFTWPLLRTNLQVFFKQHGNVLNWNAILRPFTIHVWLCTVLWIIVFALVINQLFHIELTFGNEERSMKGEFTKINSLLTFLRALCQQGNEIIPHSPPCRIIYLFGYLVSSILLTAYSAFLISNLTTQEPARPFDSLTTFLKDGSYKLIAIRSSTEYAYFSEATDDLRMQIFKKLIPNEPMPFGKEDGMEAVCEKYKYAFFVTYASPQLTAQQLSKNLRCVILHFKQPLDTIFITIARQKSGPYYNIMDHHIRVMHHSGILKRLQQNAWPLASEEYRQQFRQVRLEQVFHIHLILLTGILLALILFAFEYHRERFKHIFYNFQKSYHFCSALFLALIIAVIIPLILFL